jgi:hypothetical protein
MAAEKYCVAHAALSALAPVLKRWAGTSDFGR